MEGKLPTRFNKLRWLSWCLIFAVLFNVLGISGIMIARAVTAPYTFDVANSTWKTSIDQRQLTQGKTMYYNQVTNTVNMTDAGGTAYTVTATWQYHGPTPVQFFIRSTPVNVMVLKDI